jgi:hypothetical protein
MAASAARGARGQLLAAVLLGCAAYGLYVLLGAWRGHGAAPALAPGFVGSAKCGECHADLVERHAGTPHALALKPAAAPEVAGALPAPKWVPDPETGAAHRVAAEGSPPVVEARLGTSLFRLPAEWAFGSGTNGMTLLGRAEDGAYVESPLSFYRRAGWDFTVGFLGNPPEERRRSPTGKRMTADEVFDCFHCHTTGARRGPEGVELKGAQLGVQCEACHGPGEPHVRAVKLGRPLAGTVVPGKSSAQSLVTFCATCHRDDPPPGLALTDPVVVRFAPAGFQQSRCFKESGGRLSCVSCHDAHGESSKDPAFYRGVCAGCHGGPASGKPGCPVRPEGDCVSCHMPKAIVQRNSVFTDHFIRIVRRK